MATAIFIDTTSRELAVSAVSVTKTDTAGLVLRHGAKVGTLWDFSKKCHQPPAGVPIILVPKGYEALSSGGFVDVVWKDDVHWASTYVVGAQGMMGRRALGPISPIQVLVLPDSTWIEVVDTHASGYPHSNPATAAAAVAGIELRTQLRPSSIFVIEGQSDYAVAFELIPQPREKLGELPEFPEEHRKDIFPEGGEGVISHVGL